MLFSKADQAVATVRAFLREVPVDSNDLSDLLQAQAALEVIAERIEQQDQLLATARLRLDDLEDELTSALELAREGLARFADTA